MRLRGTGLAPGWLEKEGPPCGCGNSDFEPCAPSPSRRRQTRTSGLTARFVSAWPPRVLIAPSYGQRPRRARHNEARFDDANPEGYQNAAILNAVRGQHADAQQGESDRGRSSRISDRALEAPNPTTGDAPPPVARRVPFLKKRTFARWPLGRSRPGPIRARSRRGSKSYLIPRRSYELTCQGRRPSPSRICARRSSLFRRATVFRKLRWRQRLAAPEATNRIDG